MTQSDVRVSVATVTFRHGRFIRDMIESVLEQDIDDWELVVGDDASDDDTQEIVREYARVDPRIRLLPCDEHLGPRANFVRTLNACRGKYLTQLDGDDFYTSSSKLRKQAELLDANPDCATCVCASIEVDENGAPLGITVHPPDIREHYTVEDLAVRNFANSCAVMVRNHQYETLPEWFWDTPVGDWSLHVINACYGAIGYIDETLAAHRRHGDGMWVGKDAVQQLAVTQKTQEFLLAHIGPERAERVRPRILKETFARARELERDGDFSGAKAYLDWCRAENAKRRVLSPIKLWKRRVRVAWRAR